MTINLIRPSKSKGYTKFARAMDWALFWLSFPFAGWLLYRSWPKPDLWFWVCLAAIPVSFVMAYKDWQGGLEDLMHKVAFRKR